MPCPFCGKVESVKVYITTENGAPYYTVICDASSPGGPGGCGGSSGLAEVSGYAVRKWNRRHGK